MDPCPKCDRADCPTLTMPEWDDGALQPVARARALANCIRHRVDWRARALAAEAKFRELAGKVLALPEVDHANDCTVHVACLIERYGCDCGSDAANDAIDAAKHAAL